MNILSTVWLIEALIILFRQEWSSMAQRKKISGFGSTKYLLGDQFIANLGFSTGFVFKNNVEYHPTYPLKVL